mgnify:CR=1 FL=1
MQKKLGRKRHKKLVKIDLSFLHLNLVFLRDFFDKKYPELKGRFEVLNKELIFTISKESEIHEHNWSVDFLESNVNEGRPYNGLGRKLSKEIYTDLFQLFCDNGNVFFVSSNDNCIVETVGEFDPKKLKFYITEYPNGEDCIDSVSYDGEELDNNGGDTNGKGYYGHVWTNLQND